MYGGYSDGAVQTDELRKLSLELFCAASRREVLIPIAKSETGLFGILII